MTPAIIIEIATDVLANSKGNPNGWTVETLVANWKQRIEWLSLKVGGKAWQRELFSMARSSWIATTQKTTHFIPPSEETLAWGGFLGGEFVATEALRVSAEQAFDARFGAVAA